MSLFDIEFKLFEVEAPQPKFDVSAATTSNSKFEPIFHEGLIVQCTEQPPENALQILDLDYVERQIVDPELRYLLRKSAVGKILRCRPHTVVAEFRISNRVFAELQRGNIPDGASEIPADDADQAEEDSDSEYILTQRTIPLHRVVPAFHRLLPARQQQVKKAFTARDFPQAYKLALELADAFGLETRASPATAGRRSPTRAVRVNSPQSPSSPGSSTIQKILAGVLDKPSVVNEIHALLNPSSATSPTKAEASPRRHLTTIERNHTFAVAIASQFAAWIFNVLAWCCLQLDKTSEGIAHAKAAIECNPTAIGNYTILALLSHCVGNLTEATKAINSAVKRCGEPESFSFSAARMLHEVYSSYTHILEHPAVPRTAAFKWSDVEITVPGLSEGTPHYYALTALRKFKPGEIIFQEAPRIIFPFTETTEMRKQSLYQLKGRMHVPDDDDELDTSANVVATGCSSPRVTNTVCCSQCGFLILDRVSVVEELEENHLCNLAKRFSTVYPIRTPVPCRHSCGRQFCSPICEAAAAQTWHRVDCSHGGLLSSEQLVTLHRALLGSTSVTTDIALLLFFRMCTEIITKVEAELPKSLEREGLSVKREAVIAQCVRRATEEFPVLMQLPASPKFPPSIGTVLQVLSVVSPLYKSIVDEIEVLASRIYRCCLFSHKVVAKNPLNSVVRTREELSNIPASLMNRLSTRVVTFFPVMGMALTKSQREMAKLSVLVPLSKSHLEPISGFNAAVLSGGGEGELSLDSSQSSDDARDKSATEEIPFLPGNVIIESSCNEPEAISFTMWCAQQGDDIEVQEGDELMAQESPPKQKTIV